MRIRAVWAFPLFLASAAIAAMTAFYISAVANPVAHLHGLPVELVDQDQGATSGARAIVYFNARADAGLRRGLLAASLGLVFWLVVGTVIVRWYDRLGLQRARFDQRQ